MNKKAFILLFIGILGVSSFAIGADKKSKKEKESVICMNEKNGDVSAYIKYSKYNMKGKKYFFISVLYTYCNYRGKGIGPALLKSTCSFFHGKGYKIELTAAPIEFKFGSEEYDKALKKLKLMYKKCGFQIIKTSKVYIKEDGISKQKIASYQMRYIPS